MEFSIKQMIGSDFILYQEITKRLNDYFNQLEDMVCIKLIRPSEKDCYIEIYILNEEFEDCLKITDPNSELILNSIIYTLQNLDYFCDLLHLYQKDVSISNISDYRKIYIKKFIDKCLESLDKYRVCALMVDHYKIEGDTLDFILIGEGFPREEKDFNPNKSSLKYVVKTFFDKNSFDRKLIRQRYKKAFNIFCIAKNNSGNILYH